MSTFAMNCVIIFCVTRWQLRLPKEDKEGKFMAVKVRIPFPIQSLLGGATEVEAEGKTVREIIEDLDRRYPGVKQRLCEEDGELRRFVNIFVNDQDIRSLKGLDTELSESDEIAIIPAIAGGAYFSSYGSQSFIKTKLLS